VKSHAKPLPDQLSGAPFSTRQAEEIGIGRSRLRANDLVSPFVGVRTPDTLELTPLEIARAYVPIMAAAEFFSHVTAALIHGLWLPLELERRPLIDVSVQKPARAPRDRLVRGHHLIERVGLVQEKDGFRVASPVETWCQLATYLTLVELVVAGDALLQRDRSDADQRRAELVAAADDSARPMSRRLQRAVRLVRTGSRSAKETELRLLLVLAGLPEPEINGRIVDDDGWCIAECDLVYRAARVVIEYEGDDHRTSKAIFRNDVHRYERLRDLGWRVIRVTADDLRMRPQETVERVRAALGL